MRWIVLVSLLWIILKVSQPHSSATGVKAAVEPALSEMGEHFRHLNFPAEIQRSWAGSSLHWLFAGDLNVAVCNGLSEHAWTKTL